MQRGMSAESAGDCSWFGGREVGTESGGFVGQAGHGAARVGLAGWESAQAGEGCPGAPPCRRRPRSPADPLSFTARTLIERATSIVLHDAGGGGAPAPPPKRARCQQRRVDEDGEDGDGEASGGDDEAVSTASRASGRAHGGKAIASAVRGEQAPLLHHRRQGRPRRTLLRPRATSRLQRACCRSRATTLTGSVGGRGPFAAGRLLRRGGRGRPCQRAVGEERARPLDCARAGEAAGRRRAPRVANGTAPAQRARSRYCDE